jgi:7SK snRNA methylphosphate capping enzyme
MPPKKQKLAPLPASSSATSPASPTSPNPKRARSQGGKSIAELPEAKECEEVHRKESEVVAATSSGGAATDSGVGGGEKKKHFPFIYGNYSGYYGYRSPSVEDARLKLLMRGMFEGKRCLDIGCNAGELTITIAQRYAPQHILGVDIDGSLVR